MVGEAGNGNDAPRLNSALSRRCRKSRRSLSGNVSNDELISLVDYNNDVITDSLRMAKAFGSQLKGVRVDTSRTMVDRYFCNNPEVMGSFDPRGANPVLLFALREALDKEGYQHVNIVATGGFDARRIEDYEKQGVPIDIYGVGGSLLKINIGFTGDNVILNGAHEAKAGRRFRDNPRLVRVE